MNLLKKLYWFNLGHIFNFIIYFYSFSKIIIKTFLFCVIKSLFYSLSPLLSFGLIKFSLWFNFHFWIHKKRLIIITLITTNIKKLPLYLILYFLCFFMLVFALFFIWFKYIIFYVFNFFLFRLVLHQTLCIFFIKLFFVNFFSSDDDTSK